MSTVGDVGERGLIERMLKHITPMPGMPIPFWDDVMALSLGDGRAAVFNTDMLVWGTDIPRGMNHYQAARKAVIMNYSDLGAKGVQPQAFLNNLGIPRDTRADHVEEMAKGFEAGAREYDSYVIGGDTNEAPDIIISGVAFGVAEESKLIKRMGARPGDILCVTAPFGDTASAFKILLENLEAPQGIGDKLLESVYMPKARVKEGIALSESGAATSSMDSSDGLAISLYDLRKSSGVGFRVENLPVTSETSQIAEINGINPDLLALYGGEEYELVFTVDPDRLNEAIDALKTVGCNLQVLGTATRQKNIVLMRDGSENPILKGGWDHFTGTS